MPFNFLGGGPPRLTHRDGKEVVSHYFSFSLFVYLLHVGAKTTVHQQKDP